MASCLPGPGNGVRMPVFRELVSEPVVRSKARNTHLGTSGAESRMSFPVSGGDYWKVLVPCEHPGANLEGKAPAAAEFK